MKYRKIPALLCCAAFLLSASACGKQSSTNESSATDSTITSDTTETSAAANDSSNTSDTTEPNATTTNPTEPTTTATAADSPTTTKSASQDAEQTTAPTTESPTASDEISIYERDKLPQISYSYVTLVADRITAKAGEKHVPYRLMIYGNSEGFSMCGLRIDYDNGLLPIYDQETFDVEYEVGNASADLASVLVISPTKNAIAFSAAGIKNVTEDGILCTYYFDIPEDAVSGTQYNIKLDPANFTQIDEKVLYPQVIHGYITIE